MVISERPALSISASSIQASVERVEWGGIGVGVFPLYLLLVISYLLFAKRCPKLTKKVGHKATGVLRDGRTAFPDADSGCLIAHNPGADDGIKAIELRWWHQRLVDIDALGVVAARGNLGYLVCDRDVGAFPAEYWLLDVATAKPIGGSVGR